MKSVLITGATSFLGSQIVSHLQSEGLDVHVIVRPRSDLSRLSVHQKISLHTYDGCLASLTNALREAQADVCIHLAGAYVREHTEKDVDWLLESNLRFGSHLLEAMKNSGTKRLVNAGSTFQYFNSETYAPLNLYAAMKQAFVDVLSYYSMAYDFSSVNIILPDVYGPSDWRPKIMNLLVQAHLKQTTMKLIERSTVLGLIHVEDASSAFIHSARLLIEDRDLISGQSFGVDENNRFRLDEIVSVVERCCGQSTNLIWGAYDIPRRRITLPWKGKTLPGWSPKVSLLAGVRSLVEAERKGI